jgi:hypothetical protein
MKLALDPGTPGRGIIAVSWIALVVVTITAVPAALGAGAFETAVAVVGLISFTVGFGVWIVSFGRAIARSARGDDIVVGSWVFLQTSAPAPVRIQLLGAALITLAVTVATTAASPFVWLSNLLPLGLASLWGAWHGTFPPRRATTGATGGRRGK